MSNIRIYDGRRCSVWGLALIALTAGLFLGGCVQQESQFRSIKIGKPLDSGIQRYMEVDRKMEGGRRNVVVKKYFFVTDKSGNVICKGSLGKVSGDQHGCMLQIDGSYINNLCDYVRILYSNGLVTTDQAESKASEFCKKSDINWYLFSYTLHGCPFYQLIFENKFDADEIRHNGRLIGKEEFLKLYKEGNLKGIFQFDFS